MILQVTKVLEQDVQDKSITLAEAYPVLNPDDAYGLTQLDIQKYHVALTSRCNNNPRRVFVVGVRFKLDGVRPVVMDTRLLDYSVHKCIR